MVNLAYKTARALGACAAAFALLSVSSPASAAPIDLASFGLTAAETEWLGTGSLSVSANTVSASADAFVGTVFVAATATAPYGAGSFMLTLTDFFDFSSLSATSIAAGYAEDGSFADLLFATDAATGSLAGRSSTLYAVFDLPPGIFEVFADEGAVNFMTSARLYETGEVPSPSPIPLPATGLLLLGALAGTGAFARRRR